MGTSPWSFCGSCLRWAADEIEAREDVKRRPTSKSCCANCMTEGVKFEYLLTPVRKRRRIYSGYRHGWYPLCDPCIRAWVMYGTLNAPEVDGKAVDLKIGGDGCSVVVRRIVA